MASREALGGHLADRGWMARVLDETYARIDELAGCSATRSPLTPTAARSATISRAPSTCAASAPACSGWASGSWTIRPRSSCWSTPTAWSAGARALDRPAGRC